MADESIIDNWKNYTNHHNCRKTYIRVGCFNGSFSSRAIIVGS